MIEELRSYKWDGEEPEISNGRKKPPEGHRRRWCYKIRACIWQELKAQST